MSRHHMRPSILVLGMRVFGWIFILETLYAALIYVMIRSESLVGVGETTLQLLWFAHTLKFFFLIGLVMKLVLDWAATVYYISNHHLIKFHGILRVDEQIYELKSLRALKVRQSWIGRMLNYGDLVLQLSASGYREDITLWNIANARHYERVLRAYLEESGKRPTAGENEPGEMRPGVES